MDIQKIIKTRQIYVRKQIDNIRSFLTTPKGIFETIDEMIRTLRAANKATLKDISIPSISRRIIEKIQL